MADRQEWLDWIKTKRRAQAEMQEAIRDLEGGLRIGHHGHDLTAWDISLLKQQIEGIETVVEEVIAAESLPAEA